MEDNRIEYMIDFSGYITGKAEKRFIKKSRELGQNIISVVMLFLFPTACYFTIKVEDSLYIRLFLILFIGLILITYIPKSKKEQKSLTPKRIFTDGESIICVADRYTESRFIDDVKKVKDYGEFYELFFPLGKVSEKFICQKDLLSKGTLEEFEALFDRKIIRMNTKDG